MCAHWRTIFYPADLPQSRWLECYAKHFDTVEVNNPFYRLPEKKTFEAWRRDGLAVYVYFNNDLSGHAVRNALRLVEIVQQHGTKLKSVEFRR